MLIVVPLADAVAQLWPLSFTSLQWRFGALGLGSRALMTPLLGLLVVLAASFVADHARAQLAVGVGAWLFAVASGFLTVVFALDAMHMSGLLDGDARAAVEISSAVALAKYLVFTVTSALLGRAGLTQSPETRRVWKGRAEKNRMIFGVGRRTS